MIAPELHAQIRRLFFAEHWRVNTIAAQLGVHHDTVRRAVESERFIRPGTQIRPSALDPYKTFITATLEQYPRLRATRLWAMVRERGYPGSAIQVQRYVRTVRPAARTAPYLRLDTGAAALRSGAGAGERPRRALSGLPPPRVIRRAPTPLRPGPCRPTCPPRRRGRPCPPRARAARAARGRRARRRAAAPLTAPRASA